MSRFKGPAAIVWGDRDPFSAASAPCRAYPPPGQRHAHQAGHFLQEEVPEEIAAAVRQVAGPGLDDPVQGYLTGDAFEVEGTDLRRRDLAFAAFARRCNSSASRRARQHPHLPDAATNVRSVLRSSAASGGIVAAGRSSHQGRS